MSAHAAAMALGCAPSTAWRVALRFRAEGEQGLLDRRTENGSLKVDEDVRGGILQIVVGRPADHGFQRSTWSLEVLAQVIAKELNVRLSLGHLSKVMRLSVWCSSGRDRSSDAPGAAVGARIGSPSCAPWPPTVPAARSCSSSTRSTSIRTRGSDRTGRCGAAALRRDSGSEREALPGWRI
ncbi:MAG: helix-turn-helix domain-containing protein [Candidatus Eisenbacteria bacterium]|nr:helix-turn-helix domain-containing protein [Candidatus Eisenbacteria bacterium]